ncbi:Glycosyltransferase involved in cell wall bisynthesis [Ruminococcus sp. YE71]|uniref:glycosyltransferase family 2 protein n=1 Tax=unclassified Ruminococcus TaxID=2608920 RepID=UPI00088F6C4A|nr:MULTISPECIES: glycosyltransferase family 2 protein [unclassified Ruminococcus]SDA10173.1 Glycosyltransferase involved in cell wall bisynthesis [Ruminococcus sp. YE78]SFW11038.1 Glycosyltransferase involved in cell wall bisynthesis [Ruminococcus sp. YE71]
MLFSIVVPCYNEKENIPLLLERFSDCIGTRRNIELVIVDNGSTDGSGKLIDELLVGYPFAVKVTVPVNKGYGYGILSGLNAAKGDFLGWTHADLQTDPADVIRAAAIIAKNGYDKNIYVKGNRKGRPAADVFFTFGMSVLEMLLTNEWLEDINAQPNMFSRSFFEQWAEPPYDFSLDLYAYYMARKKRLRMIKFPVRFPERIHGESKWNINASAKIKFIKRTIDYSIRLTKKGVK